jgi:Domain of unknown function (DUF1905)
VDWAFEGEIWYWRGPAPFHFVTVPDDACREIHAMSSALTYGWGMIPATIRIGDTTWTTALWPKDGRYIVPIKDAVRRAEGLALGDTASVWVAVRG